MQQHLPFTVLKLEDGIIHAERFSDVATTPTVYGIETQEFDEEDFFVVYKLQQHLPFTVLKQGTPSTGKGGED